MCERATRRTLYRSRSVEEDPHVHPQPQCPGHEGVAQYNTHPREGNEQAVTLANLLWTTTETHDLKALVMVELYNTNNVPPEQFHDLQEASR